MENRNRISDEELVNAILQDNRQAIGELYSRYYKKVFQKCFSLVKNHDEALDLAQEALLKAFDKLSNFRGESSFSTWLYIITHRLCLEALRKRHKEIVITSSLDNESNYLIEQNDDSTDRDEKDRIMLTLLNSLPLNEKEFLLLKYNKGESINSLQSMFNISPSAVKMRLKRSKERLNQLYILASMAGLAEALAQLG